MTTTKTADAEAFELAKAATPAILHFLGTDEPTEANITRAILAWRDHEARAVERFHADPAYRAAAVGFVVGSTYDALRARAAA